MADCDLDFPFETLQRIRPLSQSRCATCTRLRVPACLPATLALARIQLVHFVFVDVSYAILDRRAGAEPSEAAPRHSGPVPVPGTVAGSSPSSPQTLVLEPSEETD